MTGMSALHIKKDTPVTNVKDTEARMFCQNVCTSDHDARGTTWIQQPSRSLSSRDHLRGPVGAPLEVHVKITEPYLSPLHPSSTTILIPI